MSQETSFLFLSCPSQVFGPSDTNSTKKHTCQPEKVCCVRFCLSATPGCLDGQPVGVWKTPLCLVHSFSHICSHSTTDCNKWVGRCLLLTIQEGVSGVGEGEGGHTFQRLTRIKVSPWRAGTRENQGYQRLSLWRRVCHGPRMTSRGYPPLPIPPKLACH